MPQIHYSSEDAQDCETDGTRVNVLYDLLISRLVDASKLPAIHHTGERQHGRIKAPESESVNHRARPKRQTPCIHTSRTLEFFLRR